MQKKGFTLIELLVVCSIIALIATAAIYSIGYLKAKVRDAGRVSGIQEIMKGMSLYQNSIGTYPVNNGVCITDADAVSALVRGAGLVTRMPKDPLFSVLPNCFYYQSVDGNNYTLRYYLEVNSSSGTSGLHTITP